MQYYSKTTQSVIMRLTNSNTCLEYTAFDEYVESKST